MKKGDEVYFEKKFTPNHDLYWKIVRIDLERKVLEVEVDEMGHTDKQIIHVSDIKYHISTG